MTKFNWIVAAALALAGLTAVIFAWPLEYWPAGFGPGPGFLPVTLGMILAVLCTGIAIADWRERRSRDADTSAGVNLAKPTRATLAFTAYIVCFDFLGFVFATAPFLFIYLLWVESRTARGAVTISLAVTAVTYVLFVVLLNVDLPKGVLGWIS